MTVSEHMQSEVRMALNRFDHETDGNYTTYILKWARRAYHEGIQRGLVDDFTKQDGI